MKTQEEKNKKIWKKPVITFLSFKRTYGGGLTGTAEDALYHPLS